MKLLLDTSVLVAAMLEAHPFHELALPWLQRARRREFTGCVAAHSLLEVYAVLTSLPTRPRVSPQAAQELIELNILSVFEILSLSAQDYIALLEQVSSQGIVGGATYDALILHAAAQIEADQIVTLNPKDFRRLCPELSSRIVGAGER